MAAIMDSAPFSERGYVLYPKELRRKITADAGALSVQTDSGLSAHERANLLNRRHQLSSGRRPVLPRQFDYHTQRWC